MNALYEITTERDNLVIRLPKKNTDEKALAKLLDYLTFESFQRRSELTEEDAKKLTEEIKQEAWAQVRHLFVEQ